MRLFTRISRSCLALLCLILFAGQALAGSVVSSVAMEISRAGESATRRHALDAALSGAVREAVRRHLSEDEFSRRESDLSEQFFSSPSSWIIRHSVLRDFASEGSLRLSVSAEIDDSKLLGELRAKGYKVFALKANPRILVAHRGAEGSAGALAARLREDGFYAAEGGGFTGSPAELALMAKARGCNAAALVSSGNGESAESSPLTVSFSLFDVRTGESLGSGRVSASGAAPEGEEDFLSAELGSLLENEIIASLNRSGWVPGTTEKKVEVRVTGLDSPALVEELEDGFYSLAEFRAVKLKRVEPGAALFDAVAVDSGIDYSLALSTVELEGGKVSWTASTIPGEEEKVLVEGRWTRSP